MTLTEWFDQSCFMQLLIIWCVATYLFGWLVILSIIYEALKLKIKQPFNLRKLLMLLFFAPVLVPCILWFK